MLNILPLTTLFLHLSHSDCIYFFLVPFFHISDLHELIQNWLFYCKKCLIKNKIVEVVTIRRNYLLDVEDPFIQPFELKFTKQLNCYF